jgi:hypothetical protein
MRKLLLTLTMVGASLVVPAAQANIVLNGSFDENTPPSGTAPLDWTFIMAASGSDFFVGPGPFYGAFTPPNSANFGAVGSFDDTLQQVLTTVPGETYTITYELAHADSDSENDFSASWNGTVIPGSVLVNASAFDYTLYSFTEVATSTTTTLAFAGREVPSWYDLDNVSVTGTSAVPEPGYLAILPAGLVALLFARKRRAVQA